MPKGRAASAVALLLAWAPLLLLAGAVLVGATGGFSWRVAGVGLSIHQPWMLLAAGLLGLGLARHSRWRAKTDKALERAWLAVEGGAAWCAVALSLAVLVVGLTWGTRVAGGCDSYGYVSQAHLWARGQVILAQPLGLTAPWPNAAWTFTPLGYRPGTTRGTIVPAYPPGLPLMMAAAILGGGASAAFWVVPLLGALGTLLAYGVGRALFGPVAALMATAWLVTCPVFLNQLVQPMSDVPAMTCSLAAVYFALRPHRRAGLLAGLAVSLALLVRPNLALLAPAIAVLLAVGPAGQKHPRGRLLLTFALGLLPGALLLGWTQATLYGDWLRTGYPDTRTLFRFKLGRLLRNVGSYASWLWLSNTALAFVAPLALALKGRRALTATLLLLTVVVALPYAFYLPFDHWSYLRFLLPALPLVLLLACGALAAVGASRPPSQRLLPTSLLVVFLAGGGVYDAVRLGVFSLKERERYYEAVGRHVARTLPARAALFSLQQSGSLRLYGERLTVRWDLIDPLWLDRAVWWLAEHGYEAYLVLEAGEERPFERRFAGRSALAGLDWPAAATRLREPRVRVWRVADREHSRAGTPPTLIP